MMENLKREVGQEMCEILNRRISLRVESAMGQRVADQIMLGAAFSQLKAEGLTFDMELHDAMRSESHG